MSDETIKMIESISRIIVALMVGSIIGKAHEEEEWGIIIRTLILFIAFLVYVEVR